MTEYLGDDVSRKVYSFVDDDRAMLRKAEIDSEVSMVIKDENGKPKEISFRVTRNARLGSSAQWVYGEMNNMPSYHQIEFRLYKDDPGSDTAWVLPQAPPIMSKPR